MNEYATHLAKLHNKKEVTVSQDIVTDKGMIIAKSGYRLNPTTCEKIVKFKLLKPLEHSIKIQGQINAKALYDHITQILADNCWLQVIQQRIGDKVLLQRCCLMVDKFSIVQQKLTVLQLELPDIFHQGVFAAFLAYTCGITSEANTEEIQTWFLAALLRDIGFLHINNATLKKQGQLSNEEWRTIQSHPVIGHEILKNLSHFPKAASRAVLEHHEKLDGSGFPRGKTGHDISNLGQLLHLLDNVIAIYNKKLKVRNRSLRSVVPVLQVNMHSYFPNVFSSLVRTLKHAPEANSNDHTHDSLQQLITTLSANQQYVHQVIAQIKHLNHIIGYDHNDNALFSLQNIGHNIMLIINSAGLDDSNYLQELKSAGQSSLNNACNEAEDAHVMLAEIIYQLQFYQKTADLFIANHPQYRLTPLIIESQKAIQALQAPKETPINSKANSA